MDSDQYLTIISEYTGEYKEKGSKFLAYCFPFDHENQLSTRMEEVKALHPKARHYCYAYKLGLDNNHYRVNDDGEPSGTAGKPIYGQILSHQLTDILIIVVRYFGGTKLGASGLIHAYKEAALDALSKCEPITSYLTSTYIISCKYEHMGQILATLKDLKIPIDDKAFDDECIIHINIRKSLINIQLRKLKAMLLSRSPDDVNEETSVPFCTIEPSR
jgi:uncharacterized YigZ family protein